MSPREYMQKQVRGIAGGIAWTQQTFTAVPRMSPVALVDVAVDIAWERLKTGASGSSELEITKRGNLIVFRPREDVEPSVLDEAGHVSAATQSHLQPTES